MSSLTVKRVPSTPSMGLLEYSMLFSLKNSVHAYKKLRSISKTRKYCEEKGIWSIPVQHPRNLQQNGRESGGGQGPCSFHRGAQVCSSWLGPLFHSSPPRPIRSCSWADGHWPLPGGRRCRPLPTGLPTCSSCLCSSWPPLSLTGTIGQIDAFLWSESMKLRLPCQHFIIWADTLKHYSISCSYYAASYGQWGSFWFYLPSAQHTHPRSSRAR